MKIYCLLLLLLISLNLISQQVNQALIPVLDGENYGFSTEDGKTVIPPKYDFAIPFYPGYELTFVTISNKPFLINRKGKIVFEGAIDNLKSANFSKINIPALESIDLQYHCIKDDCPPFKILVGTDPLNLFDKIGEYYLVSDLKKVFLIDDKGKQKSDKYDNISHYIYGDYEYCITEDSISNKKGLLDSRGKLLLNCTYDQIIYQGKGVFTITDNNMSHDYKVVYENSNLVDHSNQKSNNLLQIIKRDSKLGVIDSIGNDIISFTYDRLYPLSGNKFIFVKANYTGIINEKEERLFSDSIKNIEGGLPYYPFTDSLIFFEINNKFLLVDINGNKNELAFDGYYIDYQKVAQGIAAVCQNNKVGIINKNAVVIIPLDYDEIICCSENQSYIVRKDKKCSWLNSYGKIIYDNFNEFYFLIKDLLFISKNGKRYYIDIKGDEYVKK